MHWPRGQKVKGQGHTVTKTVTVARLLVTRAATSVCCWCRRGSACWYNCLCFLVLLLLSFCCCQTWRTKDLVLLYGFLPWRIAWRHGVLGSADGRLEPSADGARRWNWSYHNVLMNSVIFQLTFCIAFLPELIQSVKRSATTRVHMCLYVLYILWWSNFCAV